VITGAVNARREAVVPLQLRGPGGQTVNVNAVIDTGFTDFLTLPSRLIARLGLSYQSSTRVRLADGSVVIIGLFLGAVLWDGQERIIFIHQAEGDPLIGMSLLDSYRLTVDVRDGGPVTIEALP
jgi:clan AA aspartic protease